MSYGSDLTGAILAEEKEVEDASLSACYDIRRAHLPKAPRREAVRWKMAKCSVASLADTNVSAFAMLLPFGLF